MHHAHVRVGKTFPAFPAHARPAIVLIWMASTCSHVEAITMTSWWARWRFKSPASRLFTQSFLQGADQRKHQNSASMAFVRGIHWWQVNSPHKGPVTRKMFPFDNDTMTTKSTKLYSLGVPTKKGNTLTQQTKSRLAHTFPTKKIRCMVVQSQTGSWRQMTGHG